MRREKLLVISVAVYLTSILGIALAKPPSWDDPTLFLRYICENIKKDEYAYTIVANPGETADTVEYSLANEASIDFEMCDPASNDGRVCAKKDLDRETLGQYTVTEVAKKAGSNAAADEVNRQVIVSLSDANDNAPVFESLPYSFNKPEGTAAYTVIGVISAYDNDDGYAKSVVFRISDKDGMFVLEKPDSPSNVLISKKLDFETSPIFIGDVIAEDSGNIDVGCGANVSLSSSTKIYLNVDDGPDTEPTFYLPQYSSQLQENANELDTKLVIKARDGDFGLDWNVKYSLEDSFGVFEIDEYTGNLSVLSSASVDRESEEIADGYYTLTVKAEEIMPVDFNDTVFNKTEFPGAQSATVEVTIFVTDANDNEPLFYTDSKYEDETDTYNISVSENSLGPVPQFLIYIKDADQPDNAKFDLILTGDDATYFTLSETSGLSQASLSLLVENLDYEKRQTLTFQIEASESGKTEVTIAKVTVTVLDQNDNFPTFETLDAQAHIDENPAVNSTVTNIMASDADSGEYGEITFSLQPANSGFNIDKDTGEVFVTADDLDREIRAVYYLTILATDGGNLVATTQLTITLDDVNDNAPGFQQSQYIVNWNENEESPEAIQVYASDRDDPASDNSKMEIFFDDTTIADQFIITETVTESGIQGMIVPKYPLDAEALAAECSNGVIQFQFEVFVRDFGAPQLKGSANVTVFFRDVNDHTPQFNSSVYHGSVPEDSDRYTDITTVFARDADKCLTNNDITFSVDNAFADNFLMGPTENGASSLMYTIHKRCTLQTHSPEPESVRATLDRDDQDSYDVIVYAVDSGQPRMTGNATIKVTISDINNKMPIFNGTNNDAEVIETAEIGTEVASLFASDDDLDSELMFTIPKWRCIDENGEDVDNAICSDWFNITSINEEGLITVSSELDRETVATIVLTVQVEDLKATRNLPQRSQKTFTIVIKDYNDNDPVIDAPAEGFEVSEELNIGIVIGRISATDKDENNDITFSVDNRYVDISDDGEITVGGRIDREGLPGESFSAVFIATDFDTTSLISRTSNVTVNFNVIDTNDHKPTFAISNYTCNIKENEPEDTAVCVIVGTDDDVGENAEIAYSLPGVTQFVINSTTGEIFSNEEFDRESRELYQFKLRARDNAGDLSRETEVDVVINILDIDDNDPTYASNVPNHQTISFQEEKAPNTLVGTVQKAYDADTEENQQNYYFLMYKDGNNLDDKFRLDDTSRDLFAKTRLDREINSFYTLNVLTTKNESIPSTDISAYDEAELEILTVDVVIEDINDNAPTFPRESDTTDLLYSTGYGENNIVAVLTASDPDEGLNSLLYYAILSETYRSPGGTAEPTSPAFFEIDDTNGQVKTTQRSFEGSVEVGGFFRLIVNVTDRDGASDGQCDQMILDIKIFDETETVILTSRYSEEYLEQHRAEIESDLEDALDADVVIDKIVPQETATAAPAARATNEDVTLTEIHFHATEWNETTLIPSDEIAAELESSVNDQVLIDWAVVSISTSDTSPEDSVSETELLKAILAVVSSVLILFLVVLAIAFICMRRSYKRKIKVLRATAEGNRSIDQLATNDNLKIPNTNINAGMESRLYLEDQKEAINLSYLNESTDDNNSIDDNAVDSQDSAFSGDRQGSLKEDDFDDVDIDYPNNDLENLQNVLNRRGGNNMVFDSAFGDNTAI